MIQGISEARRAISYAAMAERQQALADGDPEGPGRRQPVSSFIGVDGTNTTLNSGRFLINLKPHDERELDAPARSSAACSSETAGVAGITLYMQPVQDLTIDATVSRTQYQFVLRGRQSGRASRPGRRSWSTRLQPAAAARRRRQRPAAAGPGGLHRHRPRHRGALRHHAGDRRQRALRRLRPAHRLDDLHPVEPVPRDPGGRSRRCSARSTALSLDLSAVVGSATNGQVPLSAIANVEQRTAPLLITHLGAVPGHHDLVQPGAGRLARRRGRRDQEGASRTSALPPSFITAFQGAAAGVPGLARQRAVAAPRRGGHDVHRARRALRELHPSDHDPLDAAVGRHRRAARADARRRRPRRHRASSASSC